MFRVAHRFLDSHPSSIARAAARFDTITCLHGEAAPPAPAVSMQPVPSRTITPTVFSSGLRRLNEQRRAFDTQVAFIDAQAEAAKAFAELEKAVGGNLR